MYFSNSEEYGHHPCHATQNPMNQFITKIKHKKSVKNFYTICKDSLHSKINNLQFSEHWRRYFS